MVKLTPTIGKTLRLAREKTITNAWQLLKTAVQLFEQKQYATACFLAMTSIEEVGKLLVLRLVQGDALEAFGSQLEAPPELDTKELDSFLRDHLDKALQAAAWSLYINAGADRRHGIHPVSGIVRTSGVVLLARSGRWMYIRNRCLYADIDFASNTASSPSDFVTREHAYYFICMGFEALAEQAESGLGFDFEGRDGTSSFQFWQDRLRDLERFMKRWSTTVDVDRLDFLANPEPLRREAEKREGKQAKKKRDFVQRNVT